MSENPFDLKLQPDWVKDAAGPNPYARYEGHDGRDREEGRGGRGGFGDRREGQRRPGGPPQRGNRPPTSRDQGQRPTGGGAGSGKPAGSFPRRDDRGPRQDGPPRERFDGPRRQEADLPPAPVFIEFLPEPACVNAIARQIKDTGHAYPLFDLARLFLARPDRHRVKLAATETEHPLYEGGEKELIALDPTLIERRAFQTLRDQYYVAEVRQTEEIKGTFTRVARCRLSGTLLGPTNHHSYQPAVRRLYDQRFSRRMPFEEFLRSIESVSDPEAVEAWKEQVRTVRFFRLRAESAPVAPAVPVTEGVAPEAIEEITEPSSETPADAAPADAPAAETTAAEAAPESQAAPADAPVAEAPAYTGPVFETEADCEKHFQEHYLPQILRKKTTVEVDGETSRRIPDQGLSQAIRITWEKQRGYPGQMMFHLRRALSAQGLHVFKHRKQRIYLTSHRPTLFTGQLRDVSANVAGILNFVSEHPQSTRAQLAAKLLPADNQAPEFTRQKAALAADFHWLIQAGHIVEFQDGKLDLPLSREASNPGSPDATKNPGRAEKGNPGEKAAPAAGTAIAEPTPAPVENKGVSAAPAAAPEESVPVAVSAETDPLSEAAAEVPSTETAALPASQSPLPAPVAEPL